MLARPGLFVYLGEVDRRLVTSCTLVVVPNLRSGPRPYALLELVVTHADFRRRGYGTEILRHALASAWAMGCYKVMLLAGQTDEAVLRFYEGVGLSRGLKTGFVASASAQDSELHPTTGSWIADRDLLDRRGAMGNPLKVRPLSLTDFDRYFDLRRESLIEHPAAFTTDADTWERAPRPTLEAHLSPDRSDSPILGAWLDDELIGLLGMNREQRRSVSHKASLWGFYVAPLHRGKGVGRRLLTEMIGLARLAGVRQLRGVVTTSSAEALSLLEDLGFERFGLERDARLVDGTFHDQVYIVLPL